MSTRLVLYNADGTRLTTNDGTGGPDRIVGVDITQVANANSTAPTVAVVERQCDMGYWHPIANTPLPLYEPDPDAAPV